MNLQLFPPLTAAIEGALRASIARFGVLVPVVTDQEGRILDGHHRARIADELGVDYQSQLRPVQDDEEAREIARTLNADRRQLTPEQRREVAVALRQEGHSLRAIGGALGVDHKTVLNDTKATPGESSPRVGLDGKSYPPKRLDSRSALTLEQIEEVQARRHRGERIKDLAIEYGVHAQTMGHYVGRQRVEIQAERDERHDVAAVASELEALRKFANVYLGRLHGDYANKVIEAALAERRDLGDMTEALRRAQQFVGSVRRLATPPVLRVVSV